LPQVQRPRKWDPAKAFDGLVLILEGLFRKVVIADNCALLANAAFGGHFGTPNTITVLIGTYAFAWQIYGDFSGYSSIARGSAQLLGFHFMVNFCQPYFAQSLQDFWRRWHISLSTWLRDYLYIGLGGNRLGKLRTYINLMLTMLLGGLWHGANWTFVVWGGIHGVGLAIERLFSRQGDVSDSPTFLGRWARRVFIFHLVCLSWIFFRIPTFRGAWEQVTGLAHWHWAPDYGIAIQFLAVYALLLFLLDLQIEHSKGEYLFELQPYTVRVAAGFALCALITLIGANQAVPFSTSSSEIRAATRAIALLLTGLFLYSAGLEVVTRRDLSRISRIQRRIHEDLSAAKSIAPRAKNDPSTMLVVGSSLLLTGVDRASLKKELAPNFLVTLLPIENTQFEDWYFGLRRLFAEGSRPSIVVLSYPRGR